MKKWNLSWKYLNEDSDVLIKAVNKTLENVENKRTMRWVVSQPYISSFESNTCEWWSWYIYIKKELKKRLKED